MHTPIHLTGQLPDHWKEALAILADDLGMEPGEAGVEIRCRQGDALEVASDGATVDITWETPVQLYRALSLIPQPLASCSIRVGDVHHLQVLDGLRLGVLPGQLPVVLDGLHNLLAHLLGGV